MKTQKGFALLEGLLILVIIGLIAGTGWYVMNSKKKTNESLSNASASSASNATPKKSIVKANTAVASSQGFLTIKEWSVKFPVDKNTDDVSYDFHDDQANHQFGELTSSEFNAVKASDGKTCEEHYPPNGEYIAYIARYKTDDPNLNNPQYTGLDVAQKTLGGYVYTLATKKTYASDCLFDRSKNTIASNQAIYANKVDAYTKMFNAIEQE